MRPQYAWVPAFLLLASVAWAALSWAIPAELAAVMLPSILWHKVASVALATALCIKVFLAETFAPPPARRS